VLLISAATVPSSSSVVLEVSWSHFELSTLTISWSSTVCCERAHWFGTEEASSAVSGCWAGRSSGLPPVTKSSGAMSLGVLPSSFRASGSAPSWSKRSTTSLPKKAAASCKAVPPPSPLRALTSAPLATNIRTMSGVALLSLMASWMGVHPALSLAFTISPPAAAAAAASPSSPHANSAFTLSKSPFLTATCNGVSPYLLAPFLL